MVGQANSLETSSKNLPGLGILMAGGISCGCICESQKIMSICLIDLFLSQTQQQGFCGSCLVLVLVQQPSLAFKVMPSQVPQAIGYPDDI